MTILQALERVDTLKANKYSYDQKVGWLSELDAQVFKEIIQAHEMDDPDAAFPGYDEDTDGEQMLLVPSPYSDIYLHYLCMQIDLYNGEITKYNNSKTLYNTAYMAYDDAYTREHMPIGRAVKFLV